MTKLRALHPPNPTEYIPNTPTPIELQSVPTLTTDQTYRSIQNMKNDKAAAPSQWTNELLKLVSQDSIGNTALTKLFNALTRTPHACPQLLTNFRISALKKKEKTQQNTPHQYQRNNNASMFRHHNVCNPPKAQQHPEQSSIRLQEKRHPPSISSRQLSFRNLR